MGGGGRGEDGGGVTRERSRTREGVQKSARGDDPWEEIVKRSRIVATRIIRHGEIKYFREIYSRDNPNARTFRRDIYIYIAPDVSLKPSMISQVERKFHDSAGDI